jgi:hypothetical protein
MIRVGDHSGIGEAGLIGDSLGDGLPEMGSECNLSGE